MIVDLCDHGRRRHGRVHRSERHARPEIAAMKLDRKDLPAFPEIRARTKGPAVRKQLARTLAFVSDEGGLKMFG